MFWFAQHCCPTSGLFTVDCGGEWRRGKFKNNITSLIRGYELNQMVTTCEMRYLWNNFSYVSLWSFHNFEKYASLSLLLNSFLPMVSSSRSRPTIDKRSMRHRLILSSLTSLLTSINWQQEWALSRGRHLLQPPPLCYPKCVCLLWSTSIIFCASGVINHWWVLPSWCFVK